MRSADRSNVHERSIGRRKQRRARRNRARRPRSRVASRIPTLDAARSSSYQRNLALARAFHSRSSPRFTREDGGPVRSRGARASQTRAGAARRQVAARREPPAVRVVLGEPRGRRGRRLRVPLHAREEDGRVRPPRSRHAASRGARHQHRRRGGHQARDRGGEEETRGEETRLGGRGVAPPRRQRRPPQTPRRVPLLRRHRLRGRPRLGIQHRGGA